MFVPQTLVWCDPRTIVFIVACDPRCIMEREGSVALVCLREKAGVLGLLARGVYMMCLCHCLTRAFVSRQLLCSVISIDSGFS